MWLLCAVMLPAVVQAQFTFTTNNSAITITGYTGSGGTVVIPDSTNGYPVSNIGDEAFYGCSGLTNITIPDSVTNIGKGVFAFCTNLASVTVPNSVSNVGIYAFFNCSGLTSATISTNITSIAVSTFDSCASLTNVTIPNGVINVGSSAFQNCASLGSITIPASVTNIGLYAFDSCASLTAITVVPTNYSLAYNTNYSSKDGVLFDLKQSTLIQCPGGKAGSYIIPNVITNIIFNGGTNLAITYGVTNIGNLAFHSCTGLTCVPIPISVRVIGDWAFDSCTGLKSLGIPHNIGYIGAWAFDSCSGLTSVSMPTTPSVNGPIIGATTIQDHTFEDYTGLTKIIISGSFTKIMSFAFDGCTNVTGFYFRADAPSISNSSVFSNDINATVYYRPGFSGWGPTFGGLPTAQWLTTYGFTFTTNNGAITITGFTRGEQGAFNLIIPNTTNGLPVTTIGDQAFYDLNNMTIVTIPRSVLKIGCAAFYSCTNLINIYCQGNAPAPADDSSVFLFNNNPTVYYLPGTTGWSATFDGIPTAPWMLPKPTILDFEPNFGVQTNSFGFTISWATNISVVVEASTDLSNPVWTPVGTNTLTAGSFYFSDSQWTNYPDRFYRLRSP